jgi:ketosteroid isomerase-like protein
MDHDTADGGPAAMARRLCAAANDHDLTGLVACFAPGYRNVTPAHPQRGFTGREQVRRNWEQIFAAIPDLSAEILSCAVDGETVWTEWEHRGTRRDGSRHLMRGVVIFGVADGLADWARFYLEPVQDDGRDADAAVREQVGSGGPR